MPRATIDRFEQRKATRGKLIDAALKLFSTSGYEHATVDDISDEAGYSKGAYYFHFSTKDDVLIELLRMWTENRTELLAAEIDDSSSTADGVQHALASFFSYEAEPQWPGVLLEFWAQAMRNADVSKRLKQAYAGWNKTIAGAFERAATSGELHLDSAEDAATVALAAHDGYAVQVAIGSPGGRAMTPAMLAEALLTPLQAAVETARRSTASG